jgi:hypothetical protein
MAESILLYASTDDGLVILSRPGTSKEWLPPRHVLTGQPVLASAATTGPPIQVVAQIGGATPRTQVSMTGGRTWEAAPSDGTALPTLPADSAPPAITQPLAIPATKAGMAPVLLAVADGALQRSEDEGASWQNALPAVTPPPVVSALTTDQVRRERVYAGTLDGRVYTSADRGKTWTALEVPPLPPIHHLFVLRIG